MDAYGLHQPERVLRPWFLTYPAPKSPRFPEKMVLGHRDSAPVSRRVLGAAGGRHKAFRFGNLALAAAKKRGAGGTVLGRGDRWRVSSHSDSFFFKPAQTCGGEIQRPKVVECELTRSVAKLDPMHVDAVSRHVSDQAADAVAGTVAKLGGGLLQMDFKVMINADYTRMSSLLLSSLCTGYGLRSVETRIELQSRVGQEDNVYQNEHHGKDSTDASPLVGQSSPKKSGENPLLAYLAKIRPESSLDLGASSSPEVLQAFFSVISQQMAALGFDKPEARGFWGTIQSTNAEISQENFLKAIKWCMLVGYYIHYEEYRLSLERCIKKSQAQTEKTGKQTDTTNKKQQQGFIKRVGAILKWLKSEN